MIEVDIQSSSELPHLLDLIERVSRESDPIGVQKIFGEDLRSQGQGDAYLGISVRGLQPGQYKLTRRWVRNHHELHEDTVNPWREWDAMPVRSGGFVGQAIATPTPKIYHELNLSDDPFLADLYGGMGSCMATPIFDEGEARNWGITFRRDPHGFGISELEQWVTRANLVGRIIRNIVMAQEVQQLNQKLVGQLEEIARIQRSLLPLSLPRIDGLSIAASYLTSNEAGGDYYDFFDMGGGKWAALIADLSGHGAGAATVMAMLHTIFHDFEERSLGPGAMLAHANYRLQNRLVEGNFVTAFLGVVDPKQGRMVFANAGHNRPIHRRGNGDVVSIEGSVGLPLGVMGEQTFDDNHVSMDRGDTLVLYTDGITEAFGPPPQREMFGTNRLTEALLHCTGEPPCVVDSIHERLHAHTGTLARQDDQTIVAIKLQDEL